MLHIHFENDHIIEQFILFTTRVRILALYIPNSPTALEPRICHPTFFYRYKPQISLHRLHTTRNSCIANYTTAKPNTSNPLIHKWNVALPSVKLLSSAHLYRSRNTFLYKITIILLQQINARAANKAITRSPNQYIIYMNSSIAEEKYTTYSIYKCHNNDTTKHHRVDPLVACDNTPKNPFQSNASNLIGSMAVLEDHRKTFLAKGC